MNTTLAAAIAEFNWSLTKTIHPSRLEAFQREDWWHCLAGDKRLGSVLDQHLVSQFKLSDCPDYDFNQPLKRVALLDQETIYHWLLAIGVTLHSHTIKQTVWRQQQLLIKEQIGDQWYQFALTNGLFLYHAPIEIIDQWLANLLIDESYCQYLLTAGVLVWSACIEVPTKGWWQRLLLKIPADLPLDSITPLPVLGEHRLGLTNLLEKLIHQVCPNVFDY